MCGMVSIECDLLSQNVLFHLPIAVCIEPTSGLDSTSSKEVCACLKRIAEGGLTIVTVIHQPRYEIFKVGAS